MNLPYPLRWNGGNVRIHAKLYLGMMLFVCVCVCVCVCVLFALLIACVVGRPAGRLGVGTHADVVVKCS